jgi:hypothetical protein
MKEETSMSQSFQFSEAELDAYRNTITELGDEDDFPDSDNRNASIQDPDPEKILEIILRFEKEVRGIDWRAFYENAPKEIPKVEAYLKKLGAPFTATSLLSADSAAELPNYTISNTSDGKNIDRVIRLRGEDIRAYVIETVHNFQIAQNNFASDVAGAAMGMLLGGVACIGLKWTQDFAKGRIIGWSAKRAAKVAAQGLGGPFCANIVGLLAAWGIRSLFSKQAQLLSIVVNRTGNEMNFADSYAENGKILSLPKITGDSGSRSAILEAFRFDDGDEFAPAGWIDASKRDSALKGVKAAFKATFTGQHEPVLFKDGAYLGFTVPYSGNNACGCSLDSFANAKTYLNKEDGTFSIGQEKGSAGRAQIQSYMNSKSGGEVYMIAVCQAPYPVTI